MAHDAYGPRIRAARCFAGLSQPQLAAKLDRERQWVKRRENPPADADPTPERDLILIANATRVPIEFLLHGWNVVASDQPTIEERMEALEQRMDAVLKLAARRTARDARESAEGPDTSEGHGDEPGPDPRG